MEPLGPASAPESPCAPSQPSTAPESAWVAHLLSLLVGAALLALALLALSPFAPPPPDLREARRIMATDAFKSGDSALRPEPLERFLYAAGVLLLPLCLGASYLGVRKFLSCARRQLDPLRFEAAGAWVTTAGTLGLLLAAGIAEGHPAVRSLVPGGWLSLAAALVLALAVSSPSWRGFSMKAGRVSWTLSTSVVGALLLGALAMAVFREEHIRNVPIYWASFNAVFYSVVQVYLGRELTVDFIGQYGMYPHFLEPVFRLVGLSVFTFTLLMGLLNCLAFGCLYLFLARETRSALVSTLGTTAAFFFCYASGKAVYQPDLYFQYHPLRILFPAVLLALAQSFAERPRPWMPAALGALGAAAFLWVTDVGVIVLASVFLLLGYDALARRRAWDIPLRLFQAGTAAGLVLLVFSLYLRIAYGAFPDFGRLVLYPKAYYIYGNFMLPMPRFGLWVPVLVVYALGLLRSLVPLAEGEDRPRGGLYFLLSVLGLGLFTYYQGRSVLGNLAAASYPAIVLLALFADDLRRASPPRERAARRALLVTLLALLSFSLPAIVVITPPWIRSIAGKLEVSRSGDSTDVLRDVRFLQGLVRPGEKVVILSYHSGLFHLMTRTTNPLDIPSDSELIYRADVSRQLDYVYHRRGTAVIDKTTMSPQFVSRVSGFYWNRVENPSGNLVVLQVP